MVETENIVEEWLHALHLGYYAESFLENGYDDLEICKQIGPPDLDAIGVFSVPHRNRILEAVKSLREDGATSVYFTLDEVSHDRCSCEVPSSSTTTTAADSSFASRGSSSTSASQRTRSSRVSSSRLSPRGASVIEPGSAEHEVERLIKLPKTQLRNMLKEKLTKDGIRLGFPPYSKSVSGKPV